MFLAARACLWVYRSGSFGEVPLQACHQPRGVVRHLRPHYHGSPLHPVYAPQPRKPLLQHHTRPRPAPELFHRHHQALCTWIAADGIEECRRTCGGHGYSKLSGLPTLFQNYVQVRALWGCRADNIFYLWVLLFCIIVLCTSVPLPHSSLCWLSCTCRSGIVTPPGCRSIERVEALWPSSQTRT